MICLDHVAYNFMPMTMLQTVSRSTGEALSSGTVQYGSTNLRSPGAIDSAMNSRCRTRSFVGWYTAGVVLATICMATVALAQTSDPPNIVNQPVSQTNNADTAASFLVLAAGTEPLTYQWYRIA